MAASVIAVTLLALTGGAHAANPAVHAAEESYADFLDAHGALATIDSGLVRVVDGRDRAAWLRIRDETRAKLNGQWTGIRINALDAQDARAVGLMRRTFEELAGEASASMAPTSRCHESKRPDAELTVLQESLYACFDEIGNRLTFEGRTTTRGTALQRLQEIEESARRKALFLAMAPLWQAVNGDGSRESPYRRMIVQAAAAFRGGKDSPLDEALRALGTDSETLERWLIAVLDAWRRTNVADARLVEPWDYRHRHGEASRALNAAIPLAILRSLNERYFADLGADPRTLGVLFDLEPRPGKAPIAYADTVRIGRFVDGRWRPAIPRISGNYEHGGLYSLNELVHETGHAAHYVAVRTRPAFFWADTLFIEAFADVPSWSIFEPVWQQKYLGRSVARPVGLRELYSLVMLDVAWGLFELRMLRAPEIDPNALWTEITQNYLGIAPHPEWSWWAVRAQLGAHPGYMVKYAAGAIMTAEIRKRTREAIGGIDSGNPQWYAWISERLLKHGAELETAKLLERFLGRPLSPETLLEEIHSLADR
ncbi:MAG: hypothetical protein ACT4O5_18600 [Gammaproteobacteria bacterium]